MKTAAAIILTLTLFAKVPQAGALTVIREYIGGTPPTNSTGTGTLTNVFDVACKIWETAILDDHTLTLRFGWDDNGGAYHILMAQGGVPNRETIGHIGFNNNNNPNNFAWHLDPTPWLCEEATNYYEADIDLGGGPLNATRTFQWSPAPPYRSDLLATALHEIGHALGMSIAHASFIAESTDGDIDILSGLFTGMAVPLQYNNAGVNSHIAYFLYTNSVMSGANGAGMRLLPSALDIVSLAHLSQFNRLNLDLSPVLKMSAPYEEKFHGKWIKKLDLSWFQALPPPAGPTNYVVQSCTNLNEGNWSTVMGTPTFLNGTRTISVTIGAGNTFFRLTAE